MTFEEEKLKEKILLFLYALSKGSNSINRNTFKRYIYLYYLTSSFIQEDSTNEEDINIIIDKGDVSIVGFDKIINEICNVEFIDLEENRILIRQELIEYLSQYIENNDGTLSSQYNVILPFVNVLRTYNDQYIFTVFFSEPTFISATERGLGEIKSSNSELNRLLSAFRARLHNDKIDEYDILAYWLDYILKNYYITIGEQNV